MIIDHNDISKAARNFVSKMNGHRIFAFHAEMGAGKTTFIKAICRELGVEDVVNSPSFAIVNEYMAGDTGETIYHFDFYRINSATEAEDIGLADYFATGALCFIEWPEKIECLLPEDTSHIYIYVKTDGRREFDMP
ncbi:MAG: tRNA (adenosine(37)-N6)-threonylcarbamoyltransferase complex ATPase subunit type 1 TsaE [Tannerellaceae bacterium]|jgi:tRNA threonylcarbamoyladenosine biosynthesis protein TsaE|nr:tRNA (adenosine(37)-N6)-threonylcarbamoyltransferase complex ATPase subunit type 1 TsaE [Tannerellaceae bacterium]